MALKFRRGTTAQQSGSLAFGEPYVNTTLGTLLIGGPTGDIVLSATGTGSTGNFGPISGSGLDITGNANIAGNLTLGGAITIGDATADTVNVVASLSSSLIPQTTNAFDLGSTTKFWRDLYISTGSIKMVNPANNEVVTTINAVAGGIQIGNVQISTSSISFVDNNGNVTQNIAQSSSVGSTSNFATTGSNSFTGTQYVTGSLIASGSNIEFTTGWPAVGSESHFLRLAPFTASNGRPYQGMGIAIEHLNDGTGTYEHAIQIHSFDNDSNPTYGAELNVSPFRTHMQAYPSGSAGAGGHLANISVQDLKNGKSQALVYGDFVQIGVYNGEFVTIGNSGSVVEISGSVRANITGSIAATNGVVSGSSQVTLQSTTGFSNYDSALATITGSLISSASAAKSTNDSQDISITNLNSTTASLSQRVGAIEAVSGTFARTNSTNTFNGNQTVSGSLYVTQDFVVLGSSSIQNVSSSTLNIGTNLITVAVNQPSVRFGGIAVIDSGSAGASGSFLYDSVEDEFIFVHKGNGTNVTSSHFLLGPETYDNLGNETYLTNNRLPKGTGKEHLVDSNISDDGTTISLASNVTITGSVTVSGTVDGVDVSILNSNINSFSSSTLGRLTNLESTSASLLIETANLETFSSSALTRLDTLEIETANLELTTASLNTSVSNLNSFSSSQLGKDATLATLTASYDGRWTTLATTTGSINTSLSNLNTTTASLNTSVSNLNTTTASLLIETANLETFTASLSTTSNVRFGSLGIGMAASGTSGRIDAANDIVAFSTSDIRFKENITPIENPIDKIRKISGNTYDWKAELKDIHGYEGNDVGVIAQEVEAVLPQLVQNRDNGYKAVKYDKLVALLIEGIKEQQLQIEQLRIDLNNCTNNKGL